MWGARASLPGAGPVGVGAGAASVLDGRGPAGPSLRVPLQKTLDLAQLIHQANFRGYPRCPHRPRAPGRLRRHRRSPPPARHPATRARPGTPDPCSNAPKARDESRTRPSRPAQAPTNRARTGEGPPRTGPARAKGPHGRRGRTGEGPHGRRPARAKGPPRRTVAGRPLRASGGAPRRGAGLYRCAAPPRLCRYAAPPRGRPATAAPQTTDGRSGHYAGTPTSPRRSARAFRVAYTVIAAAPPTATRPMATVPPHPAAWKASAPSAPPTLLPM